MKFHSLTVKASEIQPYFNINIIVGLVETKTKHILKATSEKTGSKMYLNLPQKQVFSQQSFQKVALYFNLTVVSGV